MTDVAAPATSNWDVADVAARALAVLRLDSGDVDESRLEELAHVACDDVDHRVDRAVTTVAPDPTDRMINVAVNRTVHLYRGKDAPFGVADSWSTDTVAVNDGGNPLRAALPDKARWGIS